MQVASNCVQICRNQRYLRLHKRGAILYFLVVFFFSLDAQACQVGERVKNYDHVTSAIQSHLIKALPNLNDSAEVDVMVSGGAWRKMAANSPGGWCLKDLRLDFAREEFHASFIPYEQDELPTTLKGKYQVSMSVPMLKERLNKGDVIQQSHIHTVRMPFKPKQERIIVVADQIIGKETQRVLLPNQLIASADIRSPQVIKRRDTISIIYETPHLTVKTLGVSLDSGSIGDRIRVRNDKSKQVISAIIKDKDTVYAAH